MIDDASVGAVARLGFTMRQARFVALVLRHAGVCLARQYCQFAQIAYGQQVHDFFRLLIDRKDARAYPCPDRRGRLYHLHAARLYRAIGEPHHRHRRTGSLGRAVERLMLLDAVLAEPDTIWLASAPERHAGRVDVKASGDPHRPDGTTDHGDKPLVRADRLPVGVRAADGTTVFVYLVNAVDPRLFRAFLRRHALQLQTLPRWLIRLAIPSHLARVEPAYRSAFDDELKPLEHVAVDELRWYFACRQRGLPTPASDDLQSRYRDAHRAYAAPRFLGLYHAWNISGDAVLEHLKSATIADAIARGAGRLESHFLPPRYHGLEHLVGTA